jgi:uncharacterized protein (TIGR02145 family)
MEHKQENNSSIIPLGSTALVRVGNSIEITSKIIKENEERIISQIIPTVKIANQIWMTQNLDVDCFANGDKIPEVQNRAELENLKTGAWCYDEDLENGLKFGKIYNWFAIKDERGIVPLGFRVPTMKDWKILFDEIYNYLISNNGDLKISKEFITIMFDDVFFHIYDILIIGNRSQEEPLKSFWTSTERNASSAFHVNFNFAGNGDFQEIFLQETFKYYGFFVRGIKT